MRPVEARPDRRQQRGQEGDGDHDADQRDEGTRVTEAAQERYGQGHQGEQAGADGDPAEGHGPPGRAHGRRHRLVVGPAPAPLLAPAGHHQQRVVDGYPQPYEGYQVLDEVADRSDGAHRPDGQERGQDRDHSHGQGDQRQQ